MDSPHGTQETTLPRRFGKNPNRLFNDYISSSRPRRIKMRNQYRRCTISTLQLTRQSNVNHSRRHSHRKIPRHILSPSLSQGPALPQTSHEKISTDSPGRSVSASTSDSDLASSPRPS